MKKKLSRVLALFMAMIMIVPSFVAYADDFSTVNYTISGTTFTYNGREITPNVRLKKRNTNQFLRKDVDYTLTYTDNVAVGIASVSVHGIGQYSNAEDIVLNYRIMPPRTRTPRVTDSTNSSISIAWDAVDENSGVTGYFVYTCDKNGDNKKYIGKTSDTKFKASNLHLASKYSFVVRAYKTLDDGTNLNGAFSNVRSYSTKPNQVEVKSVTNAKNKKSITVKWGHKNGTGYEIIYSTNKNFKNCKKVIVTKNDTLSKTISVPDASKKYYVRVRAYKEYLPGKYNYGPWSDRVSNSYNVVYSTYTSNYVNNANRTNNLKLACKAIDGKILEPGETFSFNGTVGKRTSAKGYKPAHVFAGSNETVMGVGGGVCQVASTMFNAALLGNFKIVERHQHSQRVSYVPLGRDAAIYWGSQDFKFKNNTSRPVKICMSCKNGKISCTIKVCEDVQPKKVKLKVTRNGNHFKLKRIVGGKVNYTTNSTY